MIKQSVGIYWALGGTPEQINPLFLSLFNWGGLQGEQTLDLGNPEGFVYFLIKEDDFIKYRAMAHANCMSSLETFKHHKGGVWSIAIQFARDEWNSFNNEVFLQYGEQYNTGEYAVNFDSELVLDSNES